MAHIRALNRILANFEKLRLKVVNNEKDVIANIEQLNEEWDEYKTTSSKIVETPEYTEIYNNIEKTYFDLKMTFRRKLLSLKKQPEPSSTNANSTVVDELVLTQQSFISEIQNLGKMEGDVKLPRIQVPTFSGIYEEFPSFKDLFEASIESNAKLSEVHKLQYLKSLLRGDAAELVRHIPITDGNYKETWEIVKARYDRKGQVVSNLINKFLSQPTLNQPSAKNLHHLADVSEEVLRGLKVLGPAAEIRDPWLVTIIVNKLDDVTKEAWSVATIDDDFPSITKLIQFINKRGCIMETCGPTKRNVHSKPKVLHGMFTATTNTKCPKCNEGHYLHECEDFLKMSINERKAFLQKQTICFNCLKTNHTFAKCKSKFRCRKCNKRHHTLIHLDNSSTTINQQSSNSSKQTINPENILVNTLNIEQCETILPTAIVKIEDAFGKYQTCRIMFDSGAQASFISEACVQRLSLPRKNARFSIVGLTNGTNTTRGSTTLHIQSNNLKHELKLETLILNKINCKIPNTKLINLNKNFIHSFELADPMFYEPADVDVIIGVDKFFHTLLDEKIENAIGGLVAYNTIFGWVLAGSSNFKSNKDQQLQANSATFAKEDHNIDDLLTKFWEIEELPSGPIQSTENENCERIFQQTAYRENNRFVVKLPFKENCNKLGESRSIAMKRFLSLEKQLNRNIEIKTEYSKVITEYQQLQHMKQIKNPDIHEGCYLPHRAVFKESTTTRLRVVFDGSSKTTTGISLNEVLLVGPTIQPSLWSILLRFRFHKYVLTSDIEKMYRQIALHPEHQKYQQILWRNDQKNEVDTFQLTTVTFGLSCSAYLAIKCLQQCAEAKKQQYPSASKVVLEDFYVDDLLTGTDTVEEALQLKSDLVNVLQYGSFNLRKWKSNIPLLSDSDMQDHTTTFEESTSKILGLQWDCLHDVFKFEIKDFEEETPTKRSLISNASKVFDPLGWLSPTTVLIKILFQRLWLLKLDWDDPIPDSINNVWTRFKNQLKELSTIEIIRSIPTNKYELHGFCDSSERAYAAVVYIKSFDETGKVKISLLASKTKIAPIKQVSLPRLELCGAVLLAKLISSITKSINITEVHAWTDFMIVLHWISDHPSRWKCFIGNRTSQIIALLPSQHWKHVKSSDNPADYASRGVLPSELPGLEKWWNGPIWLKEDPTKWPNQTGISSISTPEEERKCSMKLFQTNITEDSILLDVISKTNCYMKALRVLGYVRRFINNCRKSEKIKSHMTLRELNQSKYVLVKWVQQSEYEKEINHLKQSREISSSSKLKSLAPFLDEEDILRGGRLKNAEISFSSKCPIILPKDHVFTNMVINYFHQKYLHPGASLTSHLIRQQYWIVQGRSLIRNIINKCITCFKMKANLSKQLMGNLPSVRLNLPSRPFVSTGVDYAGPITISSKKGRGAKHLKAYVAVFICLNTKAIHLELTGDLSTGSFIAALKRFTSRRGLPNSLYSDNGGNFIGANSKFNQLKKMLSNDVNYHKELITYLNENNIEWHFIPPSAPNFGGLWEAAVKSMKTLLLKCIYNCFLNFEEMSTLLAEIESILNSRPLCVKSEDDSTYEALTPGHFLIGAPLTSVPEIPIEDNQNYHSRWQQIQVRRNSFWKKFSLEYFNQLQQRQKWNSKHTNLQIGDLVLIKEDGLPSNRWLMGRIIELHPGNDDLVRVVTIKTSNSILKRPINKLAKIPIN